MKEEGKRLAKEVAKLMAETEATEASEGQPPVRGRKGDELPDEMRRRASCLAKIKRMKALIEERARQEAEASRLKTEGKQPSAR
jgi:hypothetical protein